MKKIKLLLADDHQIVLDGLQAFLEKENDFEIVSTANSGEQALKIMEEFPVDVAILDISMPPGIDGFETAKEIKKKHPKIKTILLTMHNDGQYILNALKQGIHGYVVKEKSKETLVGAIHTVMKDTLYYSPELLAKIPNPNLSPDEDELKEIEFTRREKEVLFVMVENPDFTSKEIGETLSIDHTTVDKHIQNMLGKLGFKRRAKLIDYARKNMNWLDK